MTRPTENNALLGSGAVAAQLGISPVTLRRWRTEGRGPEFVQYAARGPAKYRAADVARFIDAARRKPSR